MTDQISVAVSRSAMRKAFWRILPLILLAYLCAYMDRVNVSFAAASMNADLKFSATIYGLGAGLFFLGYALFEIPSNLMLVRFGARRWLARIMITWGLLAAATMFVQTPMQFYVVRFLLGVAEAGFYPGVITYFSLWFPACHRGRAVSRFYVAGPLGSVVMGIVSGWMLDMDGTWSLHGWQWLFLLQGLPSVLVGLLILAKLPDAPATVDWLTPPEKEWIEAELASEQARIGGPASHNVLGAFRNPRVVITGILGFLLIGVVTTFILSAPLILTEATGLARDQVALLITIGGLLGAGTILFAGNFADRHGDRFLHAFWHSVAVAVTLLVIALAPSPLIVIIAYLVFAMSCFTIAMLTSSGWAELLHVRELAVGAAAINTISQVGAFVTPFAWGRSRDLSGSFTPGLFGLVVMTVMLAVLVLMVRRLARGGRRQIVDSLGDFPKTAV